MEKFGVFYLKNYSHLVQYFPLIFIGTYQRILTPVISIFFVCWLVGYWFCMFVYFLCLFIPQVGSLIYCGYFLTTRGSMFFEKNPCLYTLAFGIFCAKVTCRLVVSFKGNREHRLTVWGVPQGRRRLQAAPDMAVWG
jgi:hypothetical protein